jgi:hypothetical protein
MTRRIRAIQKENLEKPTPEARRGLASLIETKIFVAIRLVFAYSEDSSAGSGAGGTLPIGNPGLPEKACNSAVCGPLCRSQLLRP